RPRPRLSPTEHDRVVFSDLAVIVPRVDVVLLLFGARYGRLKVGLSNQRIRTVDMHAPEHAVGHGVFSARVVLAAFRAGGDGGGHAAPSVSSPSKSDQATRNLVPFVSATRSLMLGALGIFLSFSQSHQVAPLTGRRHRLPASTWVSPCDSRQAFSFCPGVMV